MYRLTIYISVQCRQMICFTELLKYIELKFDNMSKDLSRTGKEVAVLTTDRLELSSDASMHESDSGSVGWELFDDPL